ncbi:MAG: hypothetical protein GX605_14090, partial [Chloroflexi bacterium]|nr:hypothetical protein [Chloroflexota bacterium]
ERRRIGLSLRQVTEEEWGDWVASFPVEKTEPQAEEAAEDGDVAASEAAAPGDALELDATAEAPAEAEALSLAVEAEDPRGGAEEVDPQDEDPEAEGAATD